MVNSRISGMWIKRVVGNHVNKVWTLRWTKN